MFTKRVKTMDIITDSSFESGDDGRSYSKIVAKPQSKPPVRSSKHRGSPSPCPICGVIISNAYNLSCHLRRHNNDKPFKCDQCPASFILITELKRHKITHSQDRPFKCTLCIKSYKCIEILRIHMDSHGCNEYKCRYCELKFKNYKLRSNHEMSFHTISDLKCRYCYKSFAEVKFREEHEKVAHKKQLQSELLRVGVKSDLLNLTESQLATLELNETRRRKFARRRGRAKGPTKENTNLLDTNFAYYPCKFCSERFRYRRDQVAHYEEHHVEEFNKVFKKCNLCGKLLTAAHYRSHIQAHAGIFPYNCNLCDYKSTRKSDLDNHMIVHTKEYKYKCSHCQKPFRNLGPSLLCEKKHTGKKDVKCNLCEKTFFSGFDLRKHVMSKHKTRKCSFCNFETTDRYLYDRHRQGHREPKLDIKSESSKSCMCEMCGLLFNSPRLLTSHLKIHNITVNATKREHFCSYCDYKGTSNSDVLNHCMSKHSSKVDKCEFCEYSSMNHSHFLNHMKNHISDSAQEMYLCATLDKKVDKEIAAVHLECFICGFTSSVIESMKNHIESHDEMMKPFKWYCSDIYYQRLPNGCTDGNSNKKSDSFFDAKKYKTLQIKDISLPVDLCRMLKGNNAVKYFPDAEDENSYFSYTDITDDNSLVCKIEDIPIEMENELQLFSEHFIKPTDLGYSIKAESQDSDDDINSVIEVNDVCDTEILKEAVPAIKPDVTESKNLLEINRVVNKLPVTIKIKKVQLKTESPSIKRESDSQIGPLPKKLKGIQSSQVNLNLEFLKNKLQNINGKLFLSLEDLCSLSTFNKEGLLQS